MHRIGTYFTAGLLAVFLVGCNREAPKPSGNESAAMAAVAQKAESKITRVLDRENIGRRLDIFERVVGKPDDATATTAAYIVDGCLVSVENKDGAIQAITVHLREPGCSVDLAPIVHTQRVVSLKRPMTFLEFEKLMGRPAQYRAVCLPPACGGLEGRDFKAVYAPDHGSDYIEYSAGAYLQSEGTYQKVDAWVDAIAESTMGEQEYLWMVSCAHEKFDDQARRTVGSAPVEFIRFGKAEEFVCWHGEEEGYLEDERGRVEEREFVPQKNPYAADPPAITGD